MTLKEYIELYKDYDKEIDKLDAVFPQAFASDLIENTWKMFEALLEYVVKEEGLDIEDTFWFIYDNELGTNGYEINDIQINNLEDFMLFETGIRITLKNGQNVAFNINDSEELSFTYIPNDLTNEEVEELNDLIVDALMEYVK